MKIAILAVQGAFIEHEKILESLGATCIELRQASDLDREFDGLVLPGGESTVQGKLIKELGMYDRLKSLIDDGMPVLATCAGMILLADKIADDDTYHLATMPITVRRNAYGRQLGSFYTEEEFKGIGVIPMTFIRAPYVVSCAPEVEVLATEHHEKAAHIAAVRYKNQLALAFHPELDSDTRIHQYFLDMTDKYKSS